MAFEGTNLSIILPVHTSMIQITMHWSRCRPHRGSYHFFEMHQIQSTSVAGPKRSHKSALARFSKINFPVFSWIFQETRINLITTHHLESFVYSLSIQLYIQFYIQFVNTQWIDDIQTSLLRSKQLHSLNSYYRHSFRLDSIWIIIIIAKIAIYNVELKILNLWCTWIMTDIGPGR